ncbi:MAG TPA: DUF4242 domain-containing protein [Acidimicrobiia bacterium]|nr:DUF4242 domain-containing protein [Acidimicrobiia bacterium]
MPRYLVERTFPEEFPADPGSDGRRYLTSIVACNADRHVTWIHSYVSADRTRLFCLYEAPSPEAIRLTARTNGLPVDRITEVTLLDPYAYPSDPYPDA